MSYAGASLQEAIYAALTGSAEVSALAGGRVWDAPPHADDPVVEKGPWLTLGEERVEAWTAQGLNGALHVCEVSVHSGADGFAQAKRLASAATRAVTGIGDPAEGRIVTADFLGARARREKAGGRRIDLRFRFRVEM